MRDWRLTPKAFATLSDILDWTYTQFGPQQAERYKDNLIDRLDQIIVGRAPMRSCAVLTGVPDLGHLSCVPVGAHVIVCRKIDDWLEVIDFLHSRSDLPAHLTALAANPEDT